MITRENVNAAFDTLLKSINGIGDVHLDDGSIYYPDQSTPYVVGRLSAYQRKALGVGANTLMGITGNYTISVMRPAIEGRAAAGLIAGQLVAIFARGVTLATGTTQTVTILNTSEQPAQNHADWINLPIVVDFIGSDP
jgi:hypothetical protein